MNPWREHSKQPGGRWLVGSLLVLLLAGLPRGSQAAGLETLFPHQRTVLLEELAREPEAPGDSQLVSLSLSAEILALCAPDLSDLRLLGSDGEQVPYVSVEAPFLAEGRSAEQREQRVELQITGVRRQAFGPPGPRRRWLETYELRPAEAPPQGASLALLLYSNQASFVRQVRVLVPGSPVVQGSVFRLPDAAAESLVVELGDRASEGLQVQLAGEGAGYLEPRFELVGTVTELNRPWHWLQLATRERGSSEGRTWVELDRPRGLVPAQLRLRSSTPAFDRRVRVLDRKQGESDRVLASTSFYDLPGTVAEGEAQTREQLSTPLLGAAGESLRLEIEDGDSPPLADLQVEVGLRLPRLLFMLPTDAEPPLRLLYGGNRARQPRYDLGNLVSNTVLQSQPIFQAQLGPQEGNDSYEPRPALTFAQRPGASLDSRPYSWQRPLQAEPSKEGLNRLVLDSEVLAAARTDLADLRLVDREGRQWPYLLAPSKERRRVELQLLEHRQEDGRSTYRLALDGDIAAQRGLPLSSLLLEVDAPYFDRPFELRANEPGESEATQRLLAGRLQRGEGGSEPVLLAFDRTRTSLLELQVEDGDDAPLSLEQATSRLELTDLYFPAPADTYHLLVGNPEAKAPSYDLASLRDVVLAVPAADVRTEPVRANPSYRATSSSQNRQRWLLWFAIGLAVVVLAWMTLRLAREP